MTFTKITAAGIGTTESVTLDGLSVINNGSFGGNLTVGGVLTYEDVTNVDSVGLITARNGIVVGSGITLSKDGDIFATGITTISENLKVGSGVTISPDGDGFFTGVITATSYSGIDLSDVTGATGDFSIADKIVHTGDTDTAIRFSGADTVTVETGGSSRFKIDSSGNVTIGNDGDSGSNPSSGYDELCIEGGNEHIGMCFLSPAANNVDQTIAFGDSNNNQSGRIRYQHSQDAFSFDTAGSERLRIDSKGQLSSGGSTTAFDGTSSLNGLQMYYETDSGLASFGSYSSGGSTNLLFYTNSGGSAATEKLRINSSGKLFVGTTSGGDASATIRTKQLVSIDSSYSDYINAPYEAQVTINSGGQNKRIAILNSWDGQIHGNTIGMAYDGGYNMFFATNADTNDRPVERFRIGSSGICEANNSISSTYSSTSSITPHLRARNPNGTDNIYGGIQLRADRGNGAAAIFNIACLNSSTSYESTLIFQSRNTNGNFSEKMRIDSQGKLLHGCTSATGGTSEGNITIEFPGNSRNAIKTRDLDNNSTVNHMVFVSGSSAVGTITGTTGQAFYNNLSDYRSKENDVKITDGIEKIKLLRPIRFNYKVDKDTLCDGFFAHEVTPAVPTAVTGEKDAVDSEGKFSPQMLDTGKIIPLLTAALQESITKIETLESEVAALKSS